MIRQNSRTRSDAFREPELKDDLVGLQFSFDIKMKNRIRYKHLYVGGSVQLIQITQTDFI